MTYLKILLLGIFLLTAALAGDVKVIANPSVSVSAISADELKNVFLATKTSLGDGRHVEPVLEKSGATHEAFLKAYIGKTDAALATCYRSLVFTGKAPCPRCWPPMPRSPRTSRRPRAPSDTSAPARARRA
jgi:hypothetical protein